MAHRLAGFVFAASMGGAIGIAGEEPHDTTRTAGAVLTYQHELESTLTPDRRDDERLRKLHRLRNVEAMIELIRSLPESSRPADILYLASGAHLAPLALCEQLPAGVPCHLVFTEIDRSVVDAIAAMLADLEHLSLLSDLDVQPPGTAWSFLLDGREVGLELMLVSGESLIDPELVKRADLVISHDWSGDPLGNLGVVYELLLAARSWDDPPPPLMIENLESHPYPVDLSFFTPVARSTSPYGHRAPTTGSGLHSDVELGDPLFAGAILLDFHDPWWRKVDRPTFDAVFDLLVLNEFDTERQNVLSGGDDPLLAPALLDWFTGFGYRTISSSKPFSSSNLRRTLMSQSASAMSAMAPELAHRLACRLRLYDVLLRARAEGADVRSLMPSARLTARAGPGDFPTDTMEAMYRDALRHARDYRRAKESEREAARRAVDSSDDPNLERALAQCPVSEPDPGDDPAAHWLAEYERLTAELAP